jgi:hypothetical protein
VVCVCPCSPGLSAASPHHPSSVLTLRLGRLCFPCSPDRHRRASVLFCDTPLRVFSPTTPTYECLPRPPRRHHRASVPLTPSRPSRKGVSLHPGTPSWCASSGYTPPCKCSRRAAVWSSDTTLRVFFARLPHTTLQVFLAYSVRVFSPAQHTPPCKCSRHTSMRTLSIHHPASVPDTPRCGHLRTPPCKCSPLVHHTPPCECSWPPRRGSPTPVEKTEIMPPRSLHRRR